MTNATSIEDLFRRLNDASVDVAQSAVRSLSIEEDATNGLLSQYLERSPLGAELLSIWQASGDHRGVCMHCARLSHYVLHGYETGSLRPNRASDFGDSVLKQCGRVIGKMMRDPGMNVAALQLVELLLVSNLERTAKFLSQYKLPKTSFTTDDSKALFQSILYTLVTRCTERISPSLVVARHIFLWKLVLAKRPIFDELLHLNYDLPLGLVPPSLWKELFDSSVSVPRDILEAFAVIFLKIVKQSEKLTRLVNFLVKRPPTPLLELLVHRVGYHAQRYYMESRFPALGLLSDVCCQGVEEYVNQRHAFPGTDSRIAFLTFLKIFAFPRYFDEIVANNAADPNGLMVLYGKMLQRLHRLVKHYCQAVGGTDVEQLVEFALNVFSQSTKGQILALLGKLVKPFSVDVVQSFTSLMKQLNFRSSVSLRQLSEMVIAVEDASVLMELFTDLSPLDIGPDAFAHICTICDFPQWFFLNSKLFLNPSILSQELSKYRTMDAGYLYAHLEKAHKAKLKFSRENANPETESIVACAIRHSTLHGKPPIYRPVSQASKASQKSKPVVEAIRPSTNDELEVAEDLSFDHPRLCHIVQHSHGADSLLATLLSDHRLLEKVDFPLYCALRSSTIYDDLRAKVLSALDARYPLRFLGFAHGATFESKASTYLDLLSRQSRDEISVDSDLSVVLLDVESGSPYYEYIMWRLEKGMRLSHTQMARVLERGIKAHVSRLYSSFDETEDELERLVVSYYMLCEQDFASRFAAYCMRLLDEKDSSEFLLAFKYLIHNLNNTILHTEERLAAHGDKAVDMHIPVFFALVHFSHSKLRKPSMEYLLSFLNVSMSTTDSVSVLKRNHYAENILFAYMRWDSDAKASFFSALAACSPSTVGSDLMKKATFWHWVHVVVTSEGHLVRQAVQHLLGLLLGVHDAWRGKVLLTSFVNSECSPVIRNLADVLGLPVAAVGPDVSAAAPMQHDSVGVINENALDRWRQSLHAEDPSASNGKRRKL